MLEAVGDAAFLLLPVQQFPPFQADKVGQTMIAENTPNLNDKKRFQRCFLRWLVQHIMLRPITAMCAGSCVLGSTAFERLPFSVVDALKILVQAHGKVPVWKFRTLKLRLLPNASRHFQCQAPPTLLLKTPCVTPRDAKKVWRLFQSFMHTATLPKL